MKTELSSLDLFFLKRELKEELLGARIDKVYQVGERDIKITLRAGEKKVFVVTPDYLCLSGFEYETPKKPSNFAMLLRKKLGGGIIRDVRQHDFDRIIEVDVEGRGTLVLELFSRGNIIFLDEEGIIGAILESQEWKDRTLKHGLPYDYPPKMPDVTRMDESDFIMALAKDKEVVKTLSSRIGLGSTYANEVLERAGVEPDEKVGKEAAKRIYEVTGGLLSSNERARIISDGGEVDVTPFKMESYQDLEQEEKESFNRAVDEYFTRIRKKEEKKDATSDYTEELRRLERIVSKQEKKIGAMEEKAEEYQSAGDSVYESFRELDRILKGLVAAKKEGVNWLEYLKGIGMEVKDPSSRSFEYRSLKIAIDKSIPENAGTYYEKAKSAKSKLEGAKEALSKSRKRLERARESKKIAEKRIGDGPKERHRPEWYEKFRWFISSEDFLVIGGRDATTNEMLIKKHMEKDDLVFHSTVHGAPFFVVKNPKGKEIGQDTKREAAEAAASYSSAWGAGWGSADIYAFGPDQISKSPESGEYLPKGAFVIRGEREWFKGTPLKLALGFKVEENYAISIGGPETAVSSRSKQVVPIGPGNMKSGQVAKEAKASILRQTSKEDGRKIKKVVIGEIQKWIPAGKAMILK